MKIKNETSAGGIVYKQLTTNNHQLSTVWLICQHSYHKGWVFPKGLIGDHTSNESMEKAALREVEEETGIKARIVIPKPIKISYTYNWKDSAHGKNDLQEYLVFKKVFYFLMEYRSGNIEDHDSEMIDVKFVPEKKVLKYLTYPADKNAFEKILYLKTVLKY